MLFLLYLVKQIVRIFVRLAWGVFFYLCAIFVRSSHRRSTAVLRDHVAYVGRAAGRGFSECCLFVFTLQYVRIYVKKK